MCRGLNLPAKCFQNVTKLSLSRSFLLCSMRAMMTAPTPPFIHRDCLSPADEAEEGVQQTHSKPQPLPKTPRKNAQNKAQANALRANLMRRKAATRAEEQQGKESHA
jgi:hypothetical protein